MGVGTKIAAFAGCFLVLTTVALADVAIQVPKLEKANQALGHTVSQERKESQLLMSQNKVLISKLNQSDKEVQELKSDLVKQKEKVNQLSSRSSDIVRKLDDFQVTWYNGGGIAKDGKRIEDGLTVSVDPSIIPLGTWIRIEFPDGRSIERRADDTGSAVHGRILDVYKDASDDELRQLGRTFNVKVYILNK